MRNVENHRFLMCLKMSLMRDNHLLEEKLELHLENGYTLFEEVHDSTTLEPTYEENFSFVRVVHVTTPISPSHDENFALYNP